MNQQIVKSTETEAHVKAPILEQDERVLTPDAIQFLTALHNEFNPQRLKLLQKRALRQKSLDRGVLPDFLPETNYIRDGRWNISQLPDSLQDRRVEITGPVDRKMIINGLNSGAKVYMADFEDSTSPTWRNLIDGQFNLMDAVRKTITYQSDKKLYTLNEKTSMLHVRPRGWHLEEKHFEINGEPISASLFDYGLFVFHNGKLLAKDKIGPFFYLPKIENHQEARLWDDVFLFTERRLKIPRGTIKATVLIETILAAFEMDEIIYELREHIAGLNAGRWDYIFSIIKKLRKSRAAITPDRANITMAIPFMSAYSQLLVKTCHKRGVHAMGGMSAFIPSKDESVNKVAIEKVRADKIREVFYGYDGTWVAHPKLVDLAQNEFDKVLGSAPNQKDVMHSNLNISARNLLDVATSGCEISEEGIRTNINVTLLYLESWLGGVGAVTLNNIMEDAATAEISRAQLWQWLHHEKVILKDGRKFTMELFVEIQKEEMSAIVNRFMAEGRSIQNLSKAEEILYTLVTSNIFEEFLTSLAYQYID